MSSDAKPIENDGDIEIVEVMEMTDDGLPVEGDGHVTYEPESLTERSGMGDKSSSRLMSQTEVMHLLSDAGVLPYVAPPVAKNKYAKKKALKKVMSQCVVSKLRPFRPTKWCKRYMHFRLPFRNPVISFHHIRTKFLLKKRKRATRPEESEPDTSALPVSFEEYKSQMDSSCQMFLLSEGLPDAGPTCDIGVDVTDVRKYKSLLLSRINSEVVKAMLQAKSSVASGFEGRISLLDKNRNQYLLQMRRSSDFDSIRCGLKLHIHVSGSDVFADVVSVLRLKDRFRVVLKMNGVVGQDNDWEETECTVRPFGQIGHLMLQAKVLFRLEQFRLHTEFLNPVMKSLSSGIDVQISDNFRNRYKGSSDDVCGARGENLFYTDCIQKVVDTVALNQADVSSICVVDDCAESMMDSIFVDSIVYLIRKEADIMEMMSETTAVSRPGDRVTVKKYLNMLIVAKSRDALRGVRALVQNDRYYDPNFTTEEICDRLMYLKGSEFESPTDLQTVQLIESAEYLSEEYERAKKSGRETLLKTCSIVFGTIEDLLTDEHVVEMLDKNKRFFDVAVIHDASSFSDTELMSLLLFGVRKMICFTVTIKQKSNSLPGRMVRKANESNDFDSQSPVLDRGKYVQQAELRKKAAEEQRKASFSHNHSFRNSDRMCTDVRTRDSHQQQAQRTQLRPNVPFHRGRGSTSGYSGRGQEVRARGRGDVHQSVHAPTNRWRPPPGPRN